MQNQATSKETIVSVLYPFGESNQIILRAAFYSILQEINNRVPHPGALRFVTGQTADLHFLLVPEDVAPPSLRPNQRALTIPFSTEVFESLLRNISNNNGKTQESLSTTSQVLEGILLQALVSSQESGSELRTKGGVITSENANPPFELKSTHIDVLKAINIKFGQLIQDGKLYSKEPDKVLKQALREKGFQILLADLPGRTLQLKAGLNNKIEYIYSIPIPEQKQNPAPTELPNLNSEGDSTANLFGTRQVELSRPVLDELIKHILGYFKDGKNYFLIWIV